MLVECSCKVLSGKTPRCRQRRQLNYVNLQYASDIYSLLQVLIWSQLSWKSASSPLDSLDSTHTCSPIDREFVLKGLCNSMRLYLFDKSFPFAVQARQWLWSSCVPRLTTKCSFSSGACARNSVRHAASHFAKKTQREPVQVQNKRNVTHVQAVTHRIAVPSFEGHEPAAARDASD
jgi:hypothetical protein